MQGICGISTTPKITPTANDQLKTAGKLAENGIEIVKVNDIKPRSFAIVGERCTGTNLAQALISRHINVLANLKNIYGWKHGFPQKISYAHDALLVVMFRDPVDWLKSLYRKPWHATRELQSLDFSGFIRAPWETTVTQAIQFGLRQNHPFVGQPLQFDQHPISGKVFESPLALRNVKNQSFLGLENRSVNVAFVRLESLVADPALILDCISLAFGLSLKGKVTLPNNILGDRPHRAVPLAGPIPETVNDNDMDFIKENLDWSVENRLGYFI